MDDQVVRRPRFRTVIVAALVGLAGIAAFGWLVFVLQPFGERIWLTAAVVLSMIGVGQLLRRRRRLRIVVLVPLAGWLGLIAVSAALPGGPAPAPKAGADSIRVVTWNILRGKETGPPWSRNGWAVRRPALLLGLQDTQPDILCVQEALPDQVAELEEALPSHQRAGVGRDDGRAAGEHCAIFFDRTRFHLLAEGTFWLEPPIDRPPESTSLGPKRICSWVRLRDVETGRTLRIYNAHSYLTESARLLATRIILDQMARGAPGDAVVLVGDFNATPSARSRRLFGEAGLASAASLSGQPDRASYQFYGVRFRSLDAILLGPGVAVRSHRLLDMKPGNSFPSDHFGMLADLALGAPAVSAEDPAVPRAR